MIDTGFDGFLLLPESAAPNYELLETVPGAIEYADSSIAQRAYCLGTIGVDGVQQTGFVALEPDGKQPLLGMIFLKAFRFTLIVNPNDNLVELSRSHQAERSR